MAHEQHDQRTGHHGHGHGHTHGHGTDIDWADMAHHLESQAELFTPCTSGRWPGWARR